MALAPGVRLGPYEILAAIGKGGMGEVYRARDTKLDRDVAVQVLPAAWAAAPGARSGQAGPMGSASRRLGALLTTGPMTEVTSITETVTVPNLTP